MDTFDQDQPNRPSADRGPTLLRASWVAPMDRPPIRDGALVITRDRVVAVGEVKEVTVTHPDAAIHDFGRSVILPGLVNAHVHLELSHLTPPTAPGRFVDWLSNVMTAAGDAATAVRAGIVQCGRFGVTTVGDISREVSVSRAALAESVLAGVSYGEVVGMAGRRHVLGPRLAAAIDPAQATGRLRQGVSPHAPYSVDADGYRRCLVEASGRGLPLTTHLAESPDESAFLSDHRGPFRELWDRLGAWDESVPRHDGGPVRYAQALGLLDYPRSLLAHVNYCADGDLALLAAGKAGVVYCPRTHAYFGHPPHRWREMLRLGVNVAVGTDSCASSPDLNLVDDLRLLRKVAPEVPAAVLWEMATARAARALGLEDLVGTLTPGKRADLVVFPVTTDEPLHEVLEGAAVPAEVWAGGRPLSVQGG